MKAISLKTDAGQEPTETESTNPQPSEHELSAPAGRKPDAQGDSPDVSPYDLSQFTAEQLPSLLRTALKDKGYLELTPVQRSVLLANTEQQDLRISSQTGSGKTVAIGLALGRQMLQSGPRSKEAGGRSPEILLLTPTRELASQVQRELSWLLAPLQDAWVEVVTGGTSIRMERKQLARGPRIVVGTPGRVLDHLENRGFTSEKIEQVVLDEADQMLDMGFREELSKILEQLPARERTHLVSATFSGDVLRIAERYQKNAVVVAGTAPGSANKDIEHLAHVVGFRHRYDALVNLLLKAHAESGAGEPGRTLVFARTRADTLEVAERLQKDGLPAEPLSGDLAQAQRTRTLAAFRAGRISTIVATDVAARGLDVAGVDLVIHYEPPGDPDTFTHRSGRTGRAGRKGTSVLLLPPQARARVERLLRVAKVKVNFAPVPSAEKIRKLYSKLAKRNLYAMFGKPPLEEDLAYARKVLSEHQAEVVVAQLIRQLEAKPLCPPRDVSEHFGRDTHGHKSYDGRHRRDREAGPGPRRGPKGGSFSRGGRGYGTDNGRSEQRPPDGRRKPPGRGRSGGGRMR